MTEASEHKCIGCGRVFAGKRRKRCAACRNTRWTKVRNGVTTVLTFVGMALLAGLAQGQRDEEEEES